ncbi:hydrogenase 4 subunit F [Tsukamurella soli]|uniref:Hydrogenase 4 subunit F n=1 Tax=Tsukamurella soli TaxID=644556 RepID=A0ABP8JLV9_9ACTN
MQCVVVLIVVVPLVASLLSPMTVRAAEAVTVVSGVATFGLALVIGGAVAHGDVSVGGFLRVDALSAVFLLGTTFLYAVTAVYSVGYLRTHAAEPDTSDDHAERRRYLRRYYLGFNVFAWSMVCAPLVGGLALLWIAVEVTTVVSALLVALDATENATEAAWKYVLIASSGLGIALLATIFMYYAGAVVLGESYDLDFATLLGVAHHLPPTPVRLSFVLAVVGYGTKVGLFPVHTWLPDAHAEAPTPISALLSGSLLAVSFYAILRFFQIARSALGPGFPQGVLTVFGMASLLLAALYLLQQRNLKRMLAYSSVEHMGILAIAVGFGSPLAFLGAMLHVLCHAAAKGTAFMGAGVLANKFGSKELADMRGAMNVLPWSAPMFLMAVFALSGMPPFGVFRSEFQIVSGAWDGATGARALALVLLVTLAFVGLAWSTTRILFEPAGRGTAAAAIPAGEPSVWMVVPVVAGIVALLVLGVAPPGYITALSSRAAAELTSGVI